MTIHFRETEIQKEDGCEKKKKKFTIKQYLVLAGAWVNLYMCIAVPSSLTVIYVEFIYHFDSSKAMAGLVVSLCGGMRGCAGEACLSILSSSSEQKKYSFVCCSEIKH